MSNMFKKILSLTGERYYLFRAFICQGLVVSFDAILVLLISVPLTSLTNESSENIIEDVNGVYFPLKTALVLLAILPIFRILAQGAFNRSAHAIGGGISRSLFQVYLDKAVRFNMINENTSLTKLFTNEINRVTNNVVTPLVKVTVNCLYAFFLLGIMFYSSVTLSLVVTITSLLLFILSSNIIAPIVRSNARDIDETTQNIYKIVSDAVAAKFEVVVYGLAAGFEKSFFLNSSKLHRKTSDSQIMSELMRPLLEGILIPLIFAVLIFQSDFVIASIGLFFYASFKLLGAIQMIFSGITLIKTNSYALDNLLEVSNQLETIRLPDILDNRRIDSLELHDFEVYRAEKCICSVEDSRYQAGDVVGIVGPSGSGKSSFLGALLGFYNHNGQIWVNGKLTSKALYSSVSYVPQNPTIWNISPWEYITGIYSPKNSQDIVNVYEIIRRVGLDGRFENTESLVNELCGERGALLSGGEQVRLALARALYHDASLIIYDEVTSSLDQKIANDVLEIISSMSENKITLIVTHRKEDLRITNKLLNLEKHE